MTFTLEVAAAGLLLASALGGDATTELVVTIADEVSALDEVCR